MQSLRIFVGSDFHISTYLQPEYQTLKNMGVNFDKYDLFLLPGDFTCRGKSEMHQVLPMFRELKEAGKQACIVPGNHDAYDMDIRSVDSIWIKFLRDNDLDSHIHLLTPDNPLVMPALNLAVIGGTMWTDAGDHPEVAAMVDSQITDRNWITHDKEMFRSQHSAPIYHYTISKCLETAVKLREDGIQRIIFMSHHAPSHQCINEKFKKGSLVSQLVNRGYYSNADWFINLLSPDAVVWGHTHHGMEFTDDNCVQWISNPKGYFQNPAGFKCDACLEV